MSESKINVIKAVNEMRKRIEGVNREKKQGMMFETVSYDGLLDQLRDLSIELELNLVPHKCTQTNCTPYDVQRWDNKANALKSVRQNCDSYIFDFRLYHSSGEWLDISVPSVGIDPDDKGPGKATTYAAKGAWMQVLTLKRGKGFEVDAPQGDDRPAPQQKPVTETVKQFTADPKTWPTEWQKAYDLTMSAAKDKESLDAKESVNWIEMANIMDQNLNKKGCPSVIAHTIMRGTVIHLLATLFDTQHAVAAAKMTEENMDVLTKYVGEQVAQTIKAKVDKITPF